MFTITREELIGSEQYEVNDAGKHLKPRKHVDRKEAQPPQLVPSH